MTEDVKKSWLKPAGEKTGFDTLRVQGFNSNYQANALLEGAEEGLLIGYRMIAARTTTDHMDVKTRNVRNGEALVSREVPDDTQQRVTELAAEAERKVDDLKTQIQALQMRGDIVQKERSNCGRRR